MSLRLRQALADRRKDETGVLLKIKIKENLMLPANDELFELSIGVDAINAKLIDVGDCVNLNEVLIKISARGYRPLESKWCEALQKKYSNEQEEGFIIIGFVGDPAGKDRIFSYICIESGCRWKVGLSHSNWAAGFFQDFWLFAVTEVI